MPIKLFYEIGHYSGDDPFFFGMKYIICHECGFKSWNPHDVKQKYCGRCKKFHPTTSLETTPEKDECGIVAIVMETKVYTEFLNLMKFPHYEMSDFFKMEGFKTLEEVEAWWEDK